MSKKIFQKQNLVILVAAISASVLMFQNCARPTALKLTDSTADLSSKSLNKESESFNVVVPASITIAQGQEIPDIEVEVSKTGVGASEIVLKNGQNNQSLGFGELFNVKEKNVQKQNHFVKVNNFNKNQLGTYSVELNFDILNEQKIVTQTIHKTVILKIISKTGAAAVDYSEVAKCGSAAGLQNISGAMSQIESNYSGRLCGTDKANSSLLKSGSIEWTGNSPSMPAVSYATTASGGVYADLFSQPFSGASNAPTVVQWKCFGKDINGVIDSSKQQSCHARTAIVVQPTLPAPTPQAPVVVQQPQPTGDQRSWVNPSSIRLDDYYSGGSTAAAIKTLIAVRIDWPLLNWQKYRYPSNLNLYCSGISLGVPSSFSAYTQTGDLVLWNNYHPGYISYFGSSVMCTLSWSDEFGHQQQLTTSAQISPLNIKANGGYNCEQEVSAADPKMQGITRWPGGTKPSCRIGGSCDQDQNAWGICVGR